ncbi:hypothetical protein ACE1SV_00040 [Streptomyces sennicomposti]
MLLREDLVEGLSTDVLPADVGVFRLGRCTAGWHRRSPRRRGGVSLLYESPQGSAGKAADRLRDSHAGSGHPPCGEEEVEAQEERGVGDAGKQGQGGGG